MAKIHKTNKCTCTKDHVDKGMAYINGGYKEEGQVVPTTDGLAIALDVCRKTAYNWAEMESNKFREEIAYILDRVQAIQGMKIINGGLNGEFNPAFAGKLVGNHGFSDKHEVKTTSQVHVSADMSPEEAARAYQDLMNGAD